MFSELKQKVNSWDYADPSQTQRVPVAVLEDIGEASQTLMSNFDSSLNQVGTGKFHAFSSINTKQV